MSEDKLVEDSSDKLGWTLGRVLAIIGSVILIGPMVFSITSLLFATPFNKIFNYEKNAPFQGQLRAHLVPSPTLVVIIFMLKALTAAG